MASIAITSTVFFDLFTLCLSWQWDDSEGLRRTYTTVDKVVRILHGLGILSAKQRRVLHKDVRTQSVFMMRARIAYSLTGDVMDNPSCIIVAVPSSQIANFKRQRMLRDYHIHLTHAGKKYARSVEARYANVITRDQYFSEIERQGALSDWSARTIIERYQEKVGRETGDEEEERRKK